MAGRAVAETAVALLLCVVLTILGVGLLELADGTDAPMAFLDAAPRLVFGVLWPALLVWTVLLLIGNLRNRLRASGMKFVTGVVSTIAAGLVTVLGWFAFSLIGGGWGLFLFAIALVPTVIFSLSALLALLVTHLVVFRSRPARA